VKENVVYHLESGDPAEGCDVNVKDKTTKAKPRKENNDVKK
jgi:hypothetical protein